ncbi:MAG TPA: peptidoglycan-associated lipoprotein Pal [Thermoanaerobaculia bacterium]|nr:peptidoglycan-associated lipoprotein Pal [Thermoanaerobaculia bacterium]
MKKMMLKGFTAGLVMIAIVLIPACRSSRKTPPATTTGTVATDTVPDVPVTTTEEARVEPREDFVRTDPGPTVEELPRDVDALNRFVHDRGYIRDAFFGYDESALTADGQAALTSSANWLRTNPQYTVLIEGHTDERGTEQYNLALGDRRANTAREYLMALGIDGSRMRTVSYGEERPFAEGSNESAWSQNRRAHLVIVGSR